MESVLGCPIEEEDLPKLIGFLKRQETNGKFSQRRCRKSHLQIWRKCNGGGSGFPFPSLPLNEGRTYGQVLLGYDYHNGNTYKHAHTILRLRLQR